MDYDIFTDRRISERRLADDVSGEVISRRIHTDRRRACLLSEAWQWWLRVDYLEHDNRPDQISA